MARFIQLRNQDEHNKTIIVSTPKKKKIVTRKATDLASHWILLLTVGRRKMKEKSKSAAESREELALPWCDKQKRKESSKTWPIHTSLRESEAPKIYR